MTVLVGGGFGSRLHAAFGWKWVFVKVNKGWKKEEERRGREHLQPEDLGKHL